MVCVRDRTDAMTHAPLACLCETPRRLQALINRSSSRMILNAGFALEYCIDFRRNTAAV